MIVEWLAPVAVFWMVAAVYLGGGPVRYEGRGGVLQLGGLLASFALYLAAWAVLRSLIGGFLGTIPTVAVATLVTTLLLPVVCWLGFRLFGVRLRSAGSGHGGH